jgi:histidinol-phosphate aminotransferase
VGFVTPSRQQFIRVRPDLAGMAGYAAGASERGAVKLSSNESGFEPLPGVISAIYSASAEPNRYPDNHATALRTALSQRWDVGVDEVIAGCGSSLLCQELVQATCAPGEFVAFGWRSFEAYRLYTRTAHAQALTVPNAPDGSSDLPALANAITAHADRVGIVFLCSPNNPTGATINLANLERFLDLVPSTIPVVVDEAYREFATDDSPDSVDLYRGGRRNVVTLRTFSKAYGLAGLRIGYAIGAPELLNAVQAIRSPFSITAIAQAAALASLDAVEDLQQRIAVVTTERGRVHSELTAHRIPVQESQANFLWLPLGEKSAQFAEHCRDHDVLVRSFPPEGVRVSISTPADNERFLSAARSWASGGLDEEAR